MPASSVIKHRSITTTARPANKMWYPIPRMRFFFLLPCALLLVLVVSFHAVPTFGFVAPSTSVVVSSRTTTKKIVGLTCRFVKSSSNNKPPKKQVDADMEDLERARRELEQLLHSSTSGGATIETETASNNLSCAGRQRRVLELELLESLRHSDDAIDTLMDVWIHECPADIHAVDAIQVLQDSCHDLAHAETVLLQIVQEHDNHHHDHWPEPYSRLALLWFVQGRYQECERAVQTVLQQKPWHFEALQMQVLLQLVNNNNNNNNNSTNNHWAVALPYARRGLPPLQQRKRRHRWVDWAVQQAQHQLLRLEERDDRARATVIIDTSSYYANANESVWQ